MNQPHKPERIRRKAVACIIGIVALAAMLAATTYALMTSFVSVDGNLFETARVDIELNGGKVVFDGTDINLEPGRSVKRSFEVENKSTVDVYYRLYLENVTGSLQEALTFQLYDGDKLLYSGNAGDLSKENPCRDNTPLAAGEKRMLTAVVNMREDANSAFQNCGVHFDITADAVQARNNPDQAFE